MKQIHGTHLPVRPNSFIQTFMTSPNLFRSRVLCAACAWRRFRVGNVIHQRVSADSRERHRDRGSGAGEKLYKTHPEGLIKLYGSFVVLVLYLLNCT